MNYVVIIIILVLGAVASVKTRKLTVSAAILGGIIGFIIFAGSGFIGVAMLATFFMLGTLATSMGLSFKDKLGVGEVDKGRRKAGQVFANAGVAAIASVLILLSPGNLPLFTFMIAACFASAAADTLSSELGNIYGKRFYNIRTFTRDKRGLNGVVSLEGTLLGVAGSIIIALVYSLTFGFDLKIFWIVVAGTIGNIADSVLGATFERKGVLNNNAVNFLNTLIAALTAFILFNL